MQRQILILIAGVCTQGQGTYQPVHQEIIERRPASVSLVANPLTIVALTMISQILRPQQPRVRCRPRGTITHPICKAANPASVVAHQKIVLATMSSQILCLRRSRLRHRPRSTITHHPGKATNPPPASSPISTVLLHRTGTAPLRAMLQGHESLFTVSMLVPQHYCIAYSPNEPAPINYLGDTGGPSTSMTQVSAGPPPSRQSHKYRSVECAESTPTKEWPFEPNKADAEEAVSAVRATRLSFRRGQGSGASDFRASAHRRPYSADHRCLRREIRDNNRR